MIKKRFENDEGLKTIQKWFKKMKKWQKGTKVNQNYSKRDSKRFKKIQMWFLVNDSNIFQMWKKLFFSRGLNLKRVSVLFSFRRFFYPKLSSTASPDFYAIIKFSIVVYGYQKHERFFQYANIFCFLSKSFRVNPQCATQRKAVF